MYLPLAKLYDIRDFITALPESVKSPAIHIGDVDISLPETKPKLEVVTPLQFMEASLRILMVEYALYRTSVALKIHL